MGLALEKLPDWPRMMKREIAAAYLNISEAELEREILAGRLPHPVKLGNTMHWSRAEIDRCLEQLTGSNDDDWRSTVPFYAKR